MPENYTRWDVTEYLNSPQDACGYLSACLAEAPGDAALLSAALSDIARAESIGNFDLEIGGNDAELLQALTSTGHLPPQSAIKIARALELETPAAN